MIPDGYLPPLRNTEDIPIQRDSVLAMGLTTATPPFKPYVYRGWGVDILTDLPPVHYPPNPYPVPVPKPRQKPRAPRSRPRSQPVAPSPSPDLLVAVAAAREAQAMFAEFSAEVDEPKPKPRKKKDKWKKRKHSKPKPGPIRPSAGWTPISGADIDDLLAEFGVDP
jgi:hypothetical protein